MTGLTMRDVHHPLGPGRSLDIERLEVAGGEHLVVYGPNGAGKSTLLRLAAGTLRGGPAVASAYLPQRVVMFRGSVRWNLELGLHPGELPHAHSLAARFGLEALLDRPARLLSGGQRQRLALARVLATSHPLVLLDEPMAPLDVTDHDDIAAVLNDELVGRAAVIVTHDREVAATLARQMAVLVDGRIRQVGPVEEVFALPADDAVARAVGIGNVLSGKVAQSDGLLVGVEIGPLTVWGRGTVPLQRPARVLFGAEAVTVYTGDGRSEPTDTGSARNTWDGTVTELRATGRLVEALVDCGPRIAALLTPGSQEALRLERGAPVALAVKATAVRVLPG